MHNNLVFGVLLREGWLTEKELSSLGQDKLQRIKAYASLCSWSSYELP